MNWAQTLAICGSIFLAVGISREGSLTVGIVVLAAAALWPVVTNTQREIRRRNHEEMERIERKTES